jgi:hypothetical protein
VNIPCRSSAAIAGPEGISCSVTITSPDTMNESALNASESVTGALSSQPNDDLRPWVLSDSRTKMPAAGSADPYVVAIDSWLARSSLLRGTRFGTVASLAGSQTRLIASMITVATKTHHNVLMIGIVMNTAARAKSPTTSVQRRSRRSAM